MFQSLKKIVGVTHLPEHDVIYDHTFKVNHMTPDILELESNDFNPVFVPDNAMLLGKDHDLIVPGSASGFYPLSGGYTAEDFTFLCKKLGRESFPIPLKGLERDGDLPVWMTERLRIKGEIYMLRGCTILELDKVRQNGVQFQRVRVNINIPYFKSYKQQSQSYNGLWSSTYSRSKDFITTLSCHMYIGRNEYWLDQLKDDNGFFDFEPVKVSEVERVWIKKFYDYKNHR